MKLLLATDLDRTLLPNGPQPESPQARPLFSRLREHPGVTLVYVTGRHRELVEAAVRQWQIPEPDFVITDVGTRIYHVLADRWAAQPDWEASIEPDWAGHSWAELHAALQLPDEFRLQETARQNRFKLSYYVPLGMAAERPETEIRRRLKDLGVRANLVWSIDEPAGTGLLDILPAAAGKLAAIRFLIRQRQVPLSECLFAGDSGNDLDVLISDIPAVLVANASPEVRAAAVRLAERAGTRHALYLARGGFLGMNGNYSAGILEGLVHYQPQWQDWLAGPVEASS